MPDKAECFDRVVKVFDLVLKAGALAAAIVAGVSGLSAYRRSLDQEQRRLLRSERYTLCRDLVEVAVRTAFARTPEEFFPRVQTFQELLNGRFFLIGQNAMMEGFDDITEAIVSAGRTRDYVRVLPYARRLALACRNSLQDDFNRELQVLDDGPNPAIGHAPITPYRGPLVPDGGAQ